MPPRKNEQRSIPRLSEQLGKEAHKREQLGHHAAVYELRNHARRAEEGELALQRSIEYREEVGDDGPEVA